jgi:hypothetical protein
MSRELNGVNYGLAIDDSGNLKLIIGSLEYSVYTALNKQPGFVDDDTAGDLQIRVDAPSTTWALLRETSDTTSIGIVFDNGVSKGAYLKYFDGSAYTMSKLLTLADIPSSSGVVSVNGQTGVVVLTGSDIDLSSNDSTKLDVVLAGILSSIEDVKTSLAYNENGNTASQNIPAGAYVIWKDDAYKTNQAISLGDTLSSTNLDAISHGILNAINAQLVPEPMTITDIPNGANVTGIKIGCIRIVIVSFTATTVNTIIEIGTLAASDKPQITVQAICRTSNIDWGGQIQATNNTGKIQYYVKTTGSYWAQIIYVV